MLNELTNMSDLENFLAQEGMNFLYVTMPNCSVCHGLLPQLYPLLEKFPQINSAQIDASEIPEAQGQLQLFTAPVALLFVDGKEYVRKARFIPLQELEYDVNKIYANYESAE